jgi:hypothetical protein
MFLLKFQNLRVLSNGVFAARVNLQFSPNVKQVRWAAFPDGGLNDAMRMLLGLFAHGALDPTG